MGHWPLAIAFAALLNCKSRIEKDGALAPCGECAFCRQIAGLNAGLLQIVVPIPSHKDIKEAIDLTNESLEAKRKEPFALLTSSSQLTVPIDMAREVKKRLSLKGDHGETRVVLFYQMEKMLTASADALLKLIEEPPADTVILMTAEKAENLLPTIRSRSQLIRLERIKPEVCADYLMTKYGVTPEKGMLYAQVTDGNLGRAVDLAANDDDAELSQRATGFLLFKSLIVESPPDAVSRVLEFIHDRGEAETLFLFWGSLIRDCANYAVSGDEQQIINRDYAVDIMRLSQAFVDPEVAPAMTLAIKNGLADLRLNVHIQPSVAALSLRLGAAMRTAR
jgi:DNA polymerase-3 subunit delta'